jgi:hypothetical protein
MAVLMGERFRLLFQIGVGIGAVFVAVRRTPIPRGRNSPEPFPNQSFARAAFFIVGAILILGSLWSFWLARYAGPR